MHAQVIPMFKMSPSYPKQFEPTYRERPYKIDRRHRSSYGI